MSKAVTWAYLDAEQVHRCLAAPDKASTVSALRAASEANASKLLAAPLPSFPLTKEHELILLDMYTQLIRFCQGVGFNPEKTSTLVGIVAQTHTASMAGRLVNVQAYKDFESRLIAHSVHRPPFSAQIFSMNDAKLVTEYMLQTYFRQYKLYSYAFTPREVAEVRTVSFSVPHRVPPSNLPPMVKSVPLAQWEASQEEARRLEEERQQRIAEEEAVARAEAERLAFEADKPSMTTGLKQQLDYIKHTVGKVSRDKLDELEAKLSALEGRVAEVNKPMSAAGPSKIPVRPSSKK